MFPFHGLFMITIPDCTKPRWRKLYFLSFFMCIVWIMILSFLMVDAANKLGTCIGIDETVMGLTLLAAGMFLELFAPSFIVFVHS